MADDRVQVNDLQAGEYRLTKGSTRFPDVLVCRLKSPDTPPPDAVDLGNGEYLVAYSRRCTHLGCSLAPTVDPGPGRLPLDGTLLRCPCHFSCFDLAQRGLAVAGPATDCLPQVAIRLEGNDAELRDWVRRESVPYGVPYEGTSKKPE